MRAPLAISLATLIAGCSGSTSTSTPEIPGADSGSVAPPEPVDASVPIDAAIGNEAGSSDVGAVPDAALSSHDFVCNQVIGVSVTGDWFTSGFETIVDSSRWQGLYQTHAFVELWADPANAVWSVPIVSPCTTKSGDPDRVVFTGVNWTYTTASEWTAAFTKVVENLKAKYPTLKRIDLMTMLRAPNNQSCGSTETVVQPFIDEAIANVVNAYPHFVTAAPKFFAPNCGVFTGGGPHYTAAGKAIVAKVYGDYYAHEP
jgi:hypothetical protein